MSGPVAAPEWSTHSQSFRRFLRRWGLTGNLWYLLTGVQPSALVQRSWQDDECDQWGISLLSSTGAGGRIPAVVIVAGPTSDTYIEQIDVIAYPASSIIGQCISGQVVNLFTPEGGYNPIPNGPCPGALPCAAEPGLVNSRNFILPSTVFLYGYNTAFQPPGFNPAVYQLDAWYQPANWTWFPGALCQLSPTTPADPQCPNPPYNGKQVPTGNLQELASEAAFVAKMTRIWSQQQPPMRLPAGQVLALQLGVIPSVSYVLLCTFLFHEQNAEAL